MGLGDARRLVTLIVNRCGMLNRRTPQRRANGVSDSDDGDAPHVGGRIRTEVAAGRPIDARVRPRRRAGSTRPSSRLGGSGESSPRTIPVAARRDRVPHRYGRGCRLAPRGLVPAGRGRGDVDRDRGAGRGRPGDIDRGHLRPLADRRLRRHRRDPGAPARRRARSTGRSLPTRTRRRRRGRPGDRARGAAVTAMVAARTGSPSAPSVRRSDDALANAPATPPRRGATTSAPGSRRTRSGSSSGRMLPAARSRPSGAGPPATRAEVNQFVAGGIGLTPATRPASRATPCGPPHRAARQGRAGSERFFAGGEWDRCSRGSPPPARGGLPDGRHHPRRPRLPAVPQAAWRDLAFVLPHGTPVRLVASTFGAGWDLGLEDLELSISDDGCFRETLDAAVREPDWIGSVPWVLDLPDRGPGLQRYVLSLSGRHRERAGPSSAGGGSRWR